MQCERTMVKHKAGDGEGDCCRGHCSTGAAESESSNGRRAIELGRDGARQQESTQMPGKPRQCGWHRQCRKGTFTRCTLQPTYSLLYTF